MLTIFSTLVSVEQSSAMELFDIAAGTSMQKIRNDGSDLNMLQFNPRISVDVASDESESFQLVVIPNGQILPSVKVITEPIQKNGCAIELRWYRVGYVRTGNPSYRTEYVGWWPDPLLPAEDFNVPAEFEDADILARGMTDDEPHYKLGDTCEIFLKPQDKPWFWEIWVTPKSMKTAVFWTERGNVGSAFGEALDDLVQQGLATPNSIINYRLNLQATAQIYNEQTMSGNREQGWSCEVAIPFSDLDAPRKQGQTQNWLILMVRQNYFEKVDKTHRELSMTPKLIKSAFNRYEEYAVLKLLKE